MGHVSSENADSGSVGRAPLDQELNLKRTFKQLTKLSQEAQKWIGHDCSVCPCMSLFFCVSCVHSGLFKIMNPIDALWNRAGTCNLRSYSTNVHGFNTLPYEHIRYMHWSMLEPCVHNKGPVHLRVEMPINISGMRYWWCGHMEGNISRWSSTTAIHVSKLQVVGTFSIYCYIRNCFYTWPWGWNGDLCEHNYKHIRRRGIDIDMAWLYTLERG